jgi:hypothetical protein
MWLYAGTSEYEVVPCRTMQQPGHNPSSADHQQGRDERQAHRQGVDPYAMPDIHINAGATIPEFTLRDLDDMHAVHQLYELLTGK